MSAPKRQRMSVYLPDPVAQRLREIATERDTGVNDCMRLAVAALDVMHRASREGRYVGTASDRERLDTVLVAPL